MSYDPTSRNDRTILANTLRAMLRTAGFVLESRPGTKEDVYAREVEGTDGKIRVLVYTTIEGLEVRECAKDAIRVCAVYKSRDGHERGIASAEKRVNRVGEITGITDRTLERMREVWKAAKTSERCHCGAPKFKSKARKDGSGGNLVCADLCWKRLEDITQEQPSRRRNRWGRHPGRAYYNHGGTYVNRYTGTGLIDHDWEND